MFVAVIKLILARKIKDTLLCVQHILSTIQAMQKKYFWYKHIKLEDTLYVNARKDVEERQLRCTHSRTTCLVQKIISALCLSFLLQLHATMRRMNMLYMYLKNTLFTSHTKEVTRLMLILNKLQIAVKWNCKWELQIVF